MRFDNERLFEGSSSFAAFFAGDLEALENFYEFFEPFSRLPRQTEEG